MATPRQRNGDAVDPSPLCRYGTAPHLPSLCKRRAAAPLCIQQGLQTSRNPAVGRDQWPRAPPVLYCSPSTAPHSVALVRLVCAPFRTSRLHPRALPVVLAQFSYHRCVRPLPLSVLDADCKDSRTHDSARRHWFGLSGRIDAPARYCTSGFRHISVALFTQL